MFQFTGSLERRLSPWYNFFININELQDKFLQLAKHSPYGTTMKI